MTVHKTTPVIGEPSSSADFIVRLVSFERAVLHYAVRVVDCCPAGPLVGLTMVTIGTSV